MTGFFLVHRGWRDNPLFKGEFSRAEAWLWLIENACWKPTRFDVGGKIITLDRGQLCASVRQLADAWGWPKSNVERFLTRLKTETMVELEPGHGRNIITITNYRKYQDLSEADRDSSGTATGTAAGQQRDIKEQGNKGTIEQGEEVPDGPSSQRAAARVPVPFDAHVDAWRASGASKPKTRKRNASTDAPDRPAEVSEQVWSDFLRHRAKLKADLTVTALNGFRREADRVGWPLERAIEESILRGWRGFNAEWVKKDDRGNRTGSGSRFEPDGARAFLQQSLALE